MRTVRKSIAWVTVALVVSTVSLTPASAASETLDKYCSESGDYCTYVLEKASGSIVIGILAWGDYFGRARACVTKDTRVCHGRTARYLDDIEMYEWRIVWQAHYPDEGTGQYAVRWTYRMDGAPIRIGPALHFVR
jgi:hypothetical protein